MTPIVLVISNIHDFSADLVCLQLAEAGTPFVRVNREHFSEFRFCLNPLEKTLDIRGRGIASTIGGDLRSVWFRQPVFLRNVPADPLLPDEQLSRSQWSAFTRALCLLDQAAWMNHPQRTYLAESKPYQLMVALECGFRVPTTLVTNDADSVRNAFPDSLIVKSLDTVLLRDGQDCLFTYTTIADSEQLNESNTHALPLLAQALIDPKSDLRVTVVGDVIFAVRITSRVGGILGDWRTVSREHLSYEDVTLAPEVAYACRALVDRLGLAFAAIDLVETEQGVFFIEVNPTGEWGWLTNRERRIDLAIADWLSAPPPSTSARS